jgi:hypothetical protein
MRSLAMILGVVVCCSCSESAQFRGPATYVVSTPNEPSRTGAVEQRGLLCANLRAGKVVLRLGGGCVLYASPVSEGHGASIPSGQRCVLPLAEGGREVVVRTGTIVADSSKGVDVSIGASPADAPASYLAYHLTASPPLTGDEACDELLARAPSL